MDIELSLSVAFSVRQPPGDHGPALGIVYCVIAAYLVKKSGHTHKSARSGAITLIQCFGSALNCVHYHRLFLDGVYVDGPHGFAKFHWVSAIARAKPAYMPSLALTWAQRLKRVFTIDVETFRECGGAVKVVPKALAALAGQALACIEDPNMVVIQ